MARHTSGFQPFDDGTIPASHREQLLQASRLINQAAGEIGRVRLATPLNTPVSDRLGGLLTDCNLLLYALDNFLAMYQSRKH